MAKAQALSTLMAPYAKANKIRIRVWMGNGVTGPVWPGKMPQGQAQADLTATALTGNAIFSRISKVGGTPPPPRAGMDGTNIGARNVVEFAPIVVQYPAASGGRTTKVAADACAEVFGMSAASGPAAGARGVATLSATTAKA
jgi:hypothetical protein